MKITKGQLRAALASRVHWGFLVASCLVIILIGYMVRTAAGNIAAEADWLLEEASRPVPRARPNRVSEATPDQKATEQAAILDELERLHRDYSAF